MGLLVGRHCWVCASDVGELWDFTGVFLVQCLVVAVPLIGFVLEERELRCWKGLEEMERQSE